MKDLFESNTKHVHYCWAERSWLDRQRAVEARQGIYPIILEERGNYLVIKYRRPYPSDVKVRTQVYDGVEIHWYRAVPV